MLELKKLKQTKSRARKQVLYRWAKLIAANTWEEVEAESEGNSYMERAMNDLVEEITKIQPIFDAITEHPKATKEEIYN